MKAAVAAGMVFVGCMTNIVMLEILVKEDPGCGNLITFSQFLFIALEGFVFTSKFGTRKPIIGKLNFLKIVFLFFLVNLLNNYAFNFNIPVPLHLIFRSGALIVNMIMGIYILKKSYTLSKYLSVLLITFGLFLCMIISGKEVKSNNTKGLSTTYYENLFWWAIGISILTIALVLSALLGILQESLFKKYGKHPMEALYYTHLLSLPIFLMISKNIYEHAVIVLESQPVVVLKLFKIPKLLLYLIGNMVSQYICVSSVYTLSSECSSLVVTLVLTLRKFASLIFSVIYFKNSFTFYHWMGSLSIFVGTLMFFDVHVKFHEMFFRTEVPDKKLK